MSCCGGAGHEKVLGLDAGSFGDERNRLAEGWEVTCTDKRKRDDDVVIWGTFVMLHCGVDWEERNKLRACCAGDLHYRYRA